MTSVAWTGHPAEEPPCDTEPIVKYRDERTRLCHVDSNQAERCNGGAAPWETFNGSCPADCTTRSCVLGGSLPCVPWNGIRPILINASRVTRNPLSRRLRTPRHPGMMGQAIG